MKRVVRTLEDDTIDRYYFMNILLLEVVNQENGNSVGERVNIKGHFYKVNKVTFYPELGITDIDLVVSK